MIAAPAISPAILRIDAAAETERIVAGIRGMVLRQWNRQGAVVGVSGGIDSAVVAFLCARALGKDRVLALFTPETESSPDRLRLGRLVAEASGVRSAVEDISSILRAAQCYKRRDQAIRGVVPEYGEGYRCRVVLPGAQGTWLPGLFSVVVQPPAGRAKWIDLDARAYRGVLSAESFKQRARKMMEYYYADLLQYAVAGSSNRLEYDQGFFVKNGDGAADFRPIAHLYRSQVCQLAAHLGVPGEILRRPRSSAGYPLEHPADESYFMLSLEGMDFCLYGFNNGMPAAAIGAAIGLDSDQVEIVYDAILAKRRAAEYLRAAPLLVEEVPEVA